MLSRKKSPSRAANLEIIANTPLLRIGIGGTRFFPFHVKEPRLKNWEIVGRTQVYVRVSRVTCHDLGVRETRMPWTPLQCLVAFQGTSSSPQNVHRDLEADADNLPIYRSKARPKRGKIGNRTIFPKGSVNDDHSPSTLRNPLPKNRKRHASCILDGWSRELVDDYANLSVSMRTCGP